MNNFMLEEHYAFTLEEAHLNYNELFSKSYVFPLNFDNIYDLLNTNNLFDNSKLDFEGKNKFQFDFITWDTEGYTTELSYYTRTILNQVYLKYYGHYIFICKNDPQEVYAKYKKFLWKYFSLFNRTFPKYSFLLDTYKDQEENLLNKLSRTRTDNKQSLLTNTGSHNENVAGQTSDTITDSKTSQVNGESQDSITDSKTSQVNGQSQESITENHADTNNESHAITKSKNGQNLITENVVSIENDTPQTADVVAEFSASQYVSNLKKSQNSKSGSSSDTETDNGQSQVGVSGNSSKNKNSSESVETSENGANTKRSSQSVETSENGTNTKTGSSSVGTTGSSSNTATGSDSLTSTESYDPDTLMKRISEIQNKYQNLISKWVNEFDGMFIEEGNI